MNGDNRIWVEKKDLIRIFNEQAEVLIDNEYDKISRAPKLFFKSLTKIRKRLERLNGRRVYKDSKPLLLVVSRRLADLSMQMSKIILGKRPGISQIPPDDLGKLPDLPINKPAIYPIFNVEDGKVYVGTTPIPLAYNFLATHHRRGLTAEEGIALSLQYPDVPENHNLYLIFRQRLLKRSLNDSVPAVRVYKRQAILSWCEPFGLFNFGCPSCDLRMQYF
jgi:hypothetical protein